MKMLRLMVSGCLFLLLLSPVLAGCVSRNETKIAEAQARTDQARYDYLSAEAKAQGLALQAQSAALEAQARADAQIGMAQANSQVAIVREQEQTERETAWLSILPWLLLIVVLGGGVVGGAWLVLWYRGKAHLVQVQASLMLPAPQPQRALPVQVERVALPGPVERRAKATGTKPVQQGAYWLLVDHGGDVVEVMGQRR
jgi:outer membrane murein-binding lipoprotein Lpp